MTKAKSWFWCTRKIFLFWKKKHKNSFQTLPCKQLFLNIFSQHRLLRTQAYSLQVNRSARVHWFTCCWSLVCFSADSSFACAPSPRWRSRTGTRAEDPSVSCLQPVTRVNQRRLSVLSAESAGVSRGAQVMAGGGGGAGGAAGGAGSQRTLRGCPVLSGGTCSYWLWSCKLLLLLTL